MIGYPSGQDGAILPARDFSLGPARSIFLCFIFYNKSFIDKACSVKVVSVQKKKKLGQLPICILSSGVLSEGKGRALQARCHQVFLFCTVGLDSLLLLNFGESYVPSLCFCLVIGICLYILPWSGCRRVAAVRLATFHNLLPRAFGSEGCQW